METFDQKDVTAILPAKDGSCYFAQSRRIYNLVPYSSDPPTLEFSGSMVVRRMEFVANHANDERYIQICSGSDGSWRRGYDTQERIEKTYKHHNRIVPHPRADQMTLKWSGYADGPCAYENAKGVRWCARGGLQFCTARRGRWRDGHTLGYLRLPPGSLVQWQVRIPDTSTLLAAGVFLHHNVSTYAVCARRFDAATGKFEGAADLEIAKFGPDIWPHAVATKGSIAFYAYPNGSGEDDNATYAWRTEILPDLTVRAAPAWYPDIKTAADAFNDLSCSIMGDRAAWVGLDRALYYRTAQTGKLRKFRPNGRRKVRGCAFSPDGQTLWAFDTACIFRVDVD